MHGKTCLVTGGSAGIGYVAARELARQGASVVIVGRNAERGRAAAASIEREAGRPAAFMAADLSSRTDIARLARAFLAQHPRLDVLVNNAGALFAVRRESVDGIEMTLALNHLGPFLLTNLLGDALHAGARVVNVSSEAHHDVKAFDFDDPQAQRGAYPRGELGSAFYSLALPWAHPGLLQYARTKLANLLFTSELARRWADRGITVNALHPGVVASEFSDGNGMYGWFMRRYMSLRGISVEEGAATTIHLASSPDVAGVNGKYFIERAVAPCSAGANDAGAAARLWQLSAQMCGM